MEPCQSGLTYLFAKEAGASKPLDGSNPSGSAKVEKFFRFTSSEKNNQQGIFTPDCIIISIFLDPCVFAQ